MFRKQLDEAQAGDNIGALLRGINRDQIVRGQVLAKPGTVTCHRKFTAQVYVLTKDEGGRHTPFFNNYRPQFYFRTTDVTGFCELSLIHICTQLTMRTFHTGGVAGGDITQGLPRVEEIFEARKPKGLAIITESVSYTHLDVYKRQIVYVALLWCSGIFMQFFK